MKSKTKIEKQMQRKTNPELAGAILLAKKNEKWIRVAEILSSKRKKRTNVNLEDIDKEMGKEGTAVVPGKVLSQGEITKKIKVVALSFSEKAKEKLLKSGCETAYIIDEIKKNPEAKNIKILTK